MVNDKGAAGTFNASDALFARDFNEALVHQIVVAFQANARLGTRAQKDRGAAGGGGVVLAGVRRAGAGGGGRGGIEKGGGGGRRPRGGGGAGGPPGWGGKSPCWSQKKPASTCSVSPTRRPSRRSRRRSS